jgi:isoleucyl-tRNA synthetase
MGDFLVAKGKYDHTLNLPQTEFPMRANLAAREPQILDAWQQKGLYNLVEAHNAGKPKFVLHDGPPYANGDIHLGHLLNKVLKDIIVKYKSLSGYDAPYIPGWDTHGLPIEQQAIKALGLDRKKTDVVNFRHHCRDYALKYVNLQREQFKRLGVRGDWDHPYLTLNPEFEAEQIKVFGEMAKKGYLYKGKKPVYWCTDCETALAEAEIEYNSKVSSSIYVAFSVRDGKGKLPEDAAIIIWTTTPWTIPANLAIALHPDFTYQLVAVDGKKYLLAKELLPACAEQFGWVAPETVSSFTGRELEGVICRHPLYERDSVVILGEHVTLEAGTGCVHTAPGHGEDDYLAGQRYGLPLLSPVNDQGRFTEEAGPFAGLFVHAANKPIIEALQKSGHLILQSDFEHQYPFCWRCKHPIIFRATDQWFASIDGFREAALAAIDAVQWIPAWGHDRIYNMIRDRGDWCISRQRTWGVPIPIFYCSSCGGYIVNEETISQVSELFKQHGSDYWFDHPAAELLPEGFTCPHCGGTEFTKEKDIMDVWFDSGSSHMAVLNEKTGLPWPADLYLEGSDQHRGWFNSSLSTAVALRGTAPYKAVLTHGFTVDEKGHKMSKSSGNGLDPMEIIQELGADILRLWVASADYRGEIAVSDAIVRQSAEAYRKIRNTCRFILSNLGDFDLAKDAVTDFSELDRWALAKLNRLIARVTKAFDDYEFHVVFHAVHNFCTVELSNIYFDIAKDALYCLPANDPERRAIQTVLQKIISALVVILTPILAFTSEELWGFLRRENDPESVQLLDWPVVDESTFDEELEARFARLLKLRDLVTKTLEERRNQKVIGHNLGAVVKIYADEDWIAFLKNFGDLEQFFIVSRVELAPEAAKTGAAINLPDLPGVWAEAAAADGEKCQRCWIVKPHLEGDLCPRCAKVLNQA